jgi:hypothetical protein
MKITLALSVLFVFNFNNKVNAQNNAFEKIEYASFDITPKKSKHKNDIRIDLYYNIDKNGLVTIRNDDDYHNTLTFSTYQLSTDQINRLNSIFNNTKPLKSYVVRTKFDKDEFFQGTYKFLSVLYKNGHKDSLSFIVPFMSNDFESVYHMLDSIYWADKKSLKNIHPFPIPPYFKNSVLLNSKKSKLPNKRSLPPFRLEDQSK